MHYDLIFILFKLLFKYFIKKKPQETNYLYKLDRITQSITNIVVEAQKNGSFGETKVPNCDKKISFIY